MTNRKISDFTALTAPASTDTLPIIDQSETGTEKNKKITYANLLSKAPDGSASAPSFSFNSDPNTGISGGSDTLTFSTGGSGRLTISSTGLVTIPGDLTVSGTTTTIDTTNLDIEDKNITLGKVSSPSDTTADGGGFTLKGASDKTFNWVDSTDSWTSSEHIDLASGKVLKVAGTEVLSATNFTGTSAIATNVTVADESSDTTCNVLFTTAATGNLPPKTGTNLTFNSSTGALSSGNITVTSAFPKISLTDSDHNSDYTIQNANGDWRILDETNNVTRFTIAANGTGNFAGNLDVGAGVDVTGTITSTDNIEIDNAKAIRLYEADSNGSAYVGIKGATDKGSEASYTVSLPAAAPTANQILKANASTPTDLEWATDSGGIPDTGGTFTGKVIHNYTSSIRVPVGTTGQRDGSPANGDFRYNSTTGKFEGYQSGSWGEIGGGTTGTADLLAIASSSGTGGGSATFNGSAYRFKLVTKGTSTAVTPSNAEILRVSINGVMQQPNDGSGQGDMTDGYVVSGTDIIFDSAPPSGATYFIINMGVQIAIGNATTNTIADESSDTTCFPLFATAATGDLGLKSGSNLTFNAATGLLAATIFSGSGASLTNLPSSALTGSLPAIDGSALTGVSSQKADGCVTENSLTISNNYTMTTNKSGVSAGDIIVASGVTVTIPSGSRYVIV